MNTNQERPTPKFTLPFPTAFPQNRNSSQSAIRKRMHALSTEVREVLLDLEVIAAASPEGLRLLWLEEAILLVSDLLHQCETVAVPWVDHDGARAPLANSHLSNFHLCWTAAPYPAESSDTWEDQGRNFLEARQVLTALLESLQRALAKQPRITGNLRNHLQSFTRELREHVSPAERVQEAGDLFL